MYCPICKSEYEEGYNMCSDCNVSLVKYLFEEDTKSPELENKSGSSKFQELMLHSKYCFILCSKILVAELILLGLVFCIKRFYKEWNVFNQSWMIIFIVNIYLLPIFLPIYNGIVNFRKKHHHFIFNLFIIEITLILSFTILVFFGTVIDHGIEDRYDQRDEFTREMGVIILGQISLLAALVESVIIQMILFGKHVFLKSKSDNKEKEL